MKTKINLLLVVMLMTAVVSHADVLKSKPGGAVQGILVSANSQQIVFMCVVRPVGAKGKQINVPTETRLIFSLSAPLPMN